MKQTFAELSLVYFLSLTRYCQQVLNETVRTAKLTPVAARLQEVEGKVDQHVIPKEVSGFHLCVALCPSISSRWFVTVLQTISEGCIWFEKRTNNHLVLSSFRLW